MRGSAELPPHPFPPPPPTLGSPLACRWALMGCWAVLAVLAEEVLAVRT